MRISAGTAKGHQLRVPIIPELRPTKSIVRQAIFSILGEIKNASVLDLFAGTGSLGLESLSRGAQYATFVDKDKQACLSIEQNLKHDRLKGKGRIIHKSAENFLISEPDRQYDLIFADPPYILKIEHILEQSSRVLKNQGIVVYLHQRDYMLKELQTLICFDRRKYGETGVSFLTKPENYRKIGAERK